VHYHDGFLQKLITRMQATGVYDRSVVALTADHGEEFYEHGGWWHGTTLYEEAVHVPLKLKRPREPKAGTRRTDLVRTLDIAPTLLAAAGLPAAPSFQGIDLFTGTVEEPLLAEEDFEGNRLTSFRPDNWKLIVANPGNPRGLAPQELYDLAVDPLEQNNLAARESGRASELAAQLTEMKARIVRGREPTASTARTHAADPGT
jgi:arylsulfatase A-like enzyme